MQKGTTSRGCSCSLLPFSTGWHWLVLHAPGCGYCIHSSHDLCGWVIKKHVSMGNIQNHSGYQVCHHTQQHCH
jgi:hypothetical protein